ncbi:type II toxin-antitoxin system VapC family toxin [Kribbella solani]|uniref:type II toxin-antitoxin system VapC family toxin n=1 Tax=Kribbella solani TaxID=236067 RepID=UPI0029A806D5|nr:type II toxin-antitoxin system VapC family toxin [Kribbella solani]MDX2973636.1 type II toxin-antitoxin system VapC family toxin [Kribbella solani]MDX3003817.1 type II toxin-antitoxin system VapC family toxin [Kribbella solani]
MRIYFDSSALIKRVLVENESADLVQFLDVHYEHGDPLIASSLAWVEVSRVVLGRVKSPADTGSLVDGALSGIDERPMTAEVVSVARRIKPSILRSLDALHLATAVLVDADLVVTYDDRLAEACRRNSLAVAAPGRD